MVQMSFSYMNWISCSASPAVSGGGVGSIPCDPPRSWHQVAAQPFDSEGAVVFPLGFSPIGFGHWFSQMFFKKISRKIHHNL